MALQNLTCTFLKSCYDSSIQNAWHNEQFVSWEGYKSSSQNPVKFHFNNILLMQFPLIKFIFLFWKERIFFWNQFTKHCLFLSFWVFCWLDLACAWCHNLLPCTRTNYLKKHFIFNKKVPRNGRKPHEYWKNCFLNT